MAEAVKNQCQGPRDPFVQLPEVTDIFYDCLELIIQKKKKNLQQENASVPLSDKDQRKTPYLFSVSDLSSPFKSLTALIKHKQKSVP